MITRWRRSLTVCAVSVHLVQQLLLNPLQFVHDSRLFLSCSSHFRANLLHFLRQNSAALFRDSSRRSFAVFGLSVATLRQAVPSCFELGLQVSDAFA